MNIDRRKFFRWLGIGTAAAAVAPTALAACEDLWCGSIAGEGIIPHDELHKQDPPNKTYWAEYADYVNFSSLAIASSIDPVVENTARELARTAAESLNGLR